MSTLNGGWRSPDIVRNGLTLYLDAGTSTSYNSYMRSTTWKDMSGNGNSGSLLNGPTFDSDKGGAISFDGVDDFVGSFPVLISGQGSKTVCCFFNSRSTARRGLLGTRPLGSGTGWAFTTNRTLSGNLTYYHSGGSTLEVAAGIQTNRWYYACATYDSVAQVATLYLNGAMIGSPQSSFSAIGAVITVTGFVGQEQTQGEGLNPFLGSIAMVHIYNRALSAAEILQNYNSTKARFGL